MQAKDILIQAVGFLGTVVFFFSYQCKSNKKLFRCRFVSYLLYTVHLLMLGALTGGISYILNTFRSFCLGCENKFLKGKLMCVIICLLQLITLAVTWKGFSSVLPVAANIAATVGGYTYNARKIRIVGIFVNSPLWIIYDIIIGSWAGILDEAVSELSMIISVVRYGWKNLDKTEC